MIAALDYAKIGHFRDLSVAAPLKLDPREILEYCDGDFRDLSVAAPLKLDPREILEYCDGDFRDLSVAAPLKRFLDPLGRFGRLGFPRPIGRGPIEAVIEISLKWGEG